MKTATKEELRTVVYGEQEISYMLKRKKVKNINMRVKACEGVSVSANSTVPASRVDAFVLKNAEFILRATARFEKSLEKRQSPLGYNSGESIMFLGEKHTLIVAQGQHNHIDISNQQIHLTATDISDYNIKQRVVQSFLDRHCQQIFGEIISEIHPLFLPLNVQMPTVKIRDMKTRWGSCTPARQSITLNKKLIHHPRACIEYVVLHEFCHFIHPNHSKQFYTLVEQLMPDWKKRRQLLNS